jgi:hypothetical protein
VSRGGRKGKQLGRGGPLGFCSSTRFVKERERERRGRSRPRPGRRAVTWRPESARGNRGTREGRQQGSARAAGKAGVTCGEGKQEVGGGVDGRAAARGGVLCQRQKQEAEEQRGFRGRTREEKGPKDWFGNFRKFKGLSVN